MKKKVMIALIASIVIAVALTSCGGGGAKVESTVSTQTLGQQLIDLDKAYKEGVITEKEYKETKASLIKKYQ